MNKYKCILNDDADGLKVCPKPHDVSQVEGPVRSLRGTPVDCLSFLIADEVASFNSQTMETVYQRYEVSKALPGFGCGESDLCWTLYQQGIDYLPLLIDHAHKAGIDFFGSFRMNDTHLKSHPEGPFASEFWKTHSEYRLWGETDGKSYFDAGYDYSCEEIRSRKLATIAEAAERYDLDGIEIDMSRTPYYFQPHEAWEKRGILTDFLRQIKGTLEDIGSRRGRPVLMMLRTVFDEDRLRHGGMDLRTWLEEGLPDILVQTDLANTFRSDMEPWLSICKQRGIGFYPAIEATLYTDRRNFYDIFTNPDAPPHNYIAAPNVSIFSVPYEQDFLQRQKMGFVYKDAWAIAAMAQNYCSQDVSGLYLFNMFVRPNGTPPPDYLVKLFDFHRSNKRYHFWKGLPTYVQSLRPAQFHQTLEFPVCGKDIGGSDSRVTISFRQMTVPFPHVEKYRPPVGMPTGVMKYCVNGTEVNEQDITRTRQRADRIPSGFTLKAHELIQINLPGTALKDGTNTLAISIPRFPTDRDPYVYIFELDVEVRF